MGFETTESRYQDTVALTMVASAARTTTANGSSVDPEGAIVGIFALDITTASGTSPTLDVTIEVQDAAGAWHTAGTFAQAVDDTGDSTIAVPLGGRAARAAWTIAGTSPSFTFSVIGEGKR